MIIWRFTDGKLGHENQTAGLVSALRAIQGDVTVIDIPVCTLPTSGTLLFRAFFRKKIVQFPPEKPDLIIGAGHKTHIPMVVAKSQCGGKNVVLMRPSIPMGLFDLVVTPKHDNIPLRENVIETEGALNVVQFVENKNMDIGLMLIGGASPHYSWDDVGIANQIKQITDQESDVEWTLTTSRRTPEKLLNMLRDIQIKVVPFKDTNNDWIASHYAQSGQIWVTPDSVSMVYEALSSGAVTKVFYLSPSSTASRVRNGVDELIQNKALQPFDLWKNDSTIEHSSCYFNEAARIAEHIKEHLL